MSRGRDAIAPSDQYSSVSMSRRNCACKGSGSRSTRSRKSAPRCAFSKRPGNLAWRPLPPWPASAPMNSSAKRPSSSTSQATCRKFRRRRGPARWTARATYSLPTPVGPSISTLTPASPIRTTFCRNAAVAQLSPNIRLSVSVLVTALRRSRFSITSARDWVARRRLRRACLARLA